MCDRELGDSDSESSSEYIRVIHCNRSDRSISEVATSPLRWYEHSLLAAIPPSSSQSPEQLQQHLPGVPIKRVLDVAIASEEQVTVDGDDNGLTASRQSSVEDEFNNIKNPEASSYSLCNDAPKDSTATVTVDMSESDESCHFQRLYDIGMQQQLLYVAQPPAVRYPDLSDIDEERECSSRDSMGGVDSTYYTTDASLPPPPPPPFSQEDVNALTIYQQQQQQQVKVTEEMTDIQSSPSPHRANPPSMGNQDYRTLSNSPSQRLLINSLPRRSPPRKMTISPRRKLASPPLRRLRMTHLSSPQPPKKHSESHLLRVTSSDNALSSSLAHVTPPESRFLPLSAVYRTHSASSKTSSQSADGSFNSEPSPRFTVHQYSF